MTYTIEHTEVINIWDNFTNDYYDDDSYRSSHPEFLRYLIDKKVGLRVDECDFPTERAYTPRTITFESENHFNWWVLTYA